ncbi:hypothetical protein [Streptomyces sp. ISL-24]|uniref:hypothetical protein n=2 Tax=unclassified Streptomyces TaxID=2593676 RepID=UPI0027E23AAE|nr:hypothetical protein [Streptomyces sp. ISL-24]
MRPASAADLPARGQAAATQGSARGGDGSAAAPSPRRTGDTDPARATSAAPATPQRFPNPRVPDSGTSEPMSPPPPRASARFPDAPPAAGRPEGDAASYPQGAGQATPGGTPPRPAERPSRQRRTGAPAETAAETTFRLRPIPGDPSPESANRPSPTRGSADAPPQPDPGHARRSAPIPARPATRPGAAPTGPAGRVGGVAMPAQSAGHPGAAPSSPDPSLSWSAPMTPGGAPGAGRPIVSFGEPEGYGENVRPRPLGARIRSRTAAAAACVVLGLGLIGGAATGSWLVGEPGDGDARDSFAEAGGLWHSVPVDRLFPPTVAGQGAGPGGADRTWTRIAVAPDSGCTNAFDPLLRKVLAPVGCERLLRATYTDATQSYVTTVGLLFTKADAAAMGSLGTRFTKEGLDRRTDLMPRPYAAKGTVAAGFGQEQRASWTVSVLTDAPVVVFAVSGWADARTVDEPEPAEEAMRSGATSAVAQAGLGHEAQGLADRIERALRKNVSSASEQPS